jgi:hypothetical protein
VQQGRARLLYEGLSYAVPIWWVTLDEQSNAKLRNGSAFLVDCGQGIFAATPAHVFKEYCEEKREATVIACQIGNSLFDLEARLIGCDLENDVATFRVEPSDAVVIAKSILSSRAEDWPPVPAKEGDFAFFAGFPAQSRGMSPTRHFFATVPYQAMTHITSIIDHQISCRFDREKMLDIGGYPTASRDRPIAKPNAFW